jgi:6-phospho-beta-glucosidase
VSGLKVAVIGGGSSYTPELVEGFIKRQAELPLAELRLIDVEAGREKVEIVAAMAKRQFAKAELDVKVSVHYDRKPALEGVDYVVSQLRVGLLEARAIDERIPLKYGVLGQETTGAGGFFKALRTIPVILGICRDLEEVAPNAYLINFTNPSGILAETIVRHTKVKAMGLCNNPINMHLGAARILGADPSKVNMKFLGLNHLLWAKVFMEGQDVTPRILEAMSVPAGQAGTPANVAALPWDRDFLMTLGYYPCAYQRYFYMTPEMLQGEIEAAATKGTRAEIVKKTEAELFELYKDPTLDIKPPQLAKRGGAHYSDAAVSLISAIHNDKKEIHAVNVRNGSAMPDLPADAAVEISSVISREGASPLTMGPLPPQIRGILQQVKAYEELTVAAGVTGDRNLAIQALVANPLIPSIRIATELFDEMAEAHRRYLPQFFKA